MDDNNNQPVTQPEGSQQPAPAEGNQQQPSKPSLARRLLSQKRWLLLGIALLVVLTLVLTTLLITKDSTDNNTGDTSQDLPGANIENARVGYTDDGFEPATIRIKAGQAVTWTNSHAGLLVVASDPHPEHSDVDGLESDTIDQDADYSYTFTEPGTYTYHNHLSPEVGGTVVVE